MDAPTYEQVCQIIGALYIDSQLRIQNLTNQVQKANERADQALELLKNQAAQSQGVNNGDEGT